MLKLPGLRVGGLLALAAVVLSGCKVSATSGDRYYDEPSYSRGYFLDARDTGHYFPDESWSLNHEAEVCIGETQYTRNRRWPGSGVRFFRL